MGRSWDDDAIGVTIAVVVDGTNQVHTLSAYRTQGGLDPTLGWGLVHKVNNNIVNIIDNKSVGGTNKNGGAGTGDKQGWNGRFTQVRIERTGHIVKAYTSPWSTSEGSLVIDLSSLIQVDLSDPANNLTAFMGAQSYGYESKSQSAATFSSLSFLTPYDNADPEYLFDLRDNLVYVKKSSGIGYELAVGAKALDALGYPKIITNMETQTRFSISSGTSYQELAN